jgi:hypothetical protein
MDIISIVAKNFADVFQSLRDPIQFVSNIDVILKRPLLESKSFTEFVSWDMQTWFNSNNENPTSTVLGRGN